MGTIIRVEITEMAGRRWRWTSETDGFREGSGKLSDLPDGVGIGDRIPVEVARTRSGNVATRFVPPPGTRVQHSPPDDAAVSRPHPGMKRGLSVGDIVTARVRFSAKPGRPDCWRGSKRRPVLVVAIDGHSAHVRPIHDSNSFVRREGMGRRIRRWREAGLRKPSVVSSRVIDLDRSSLGRVVGRLHDADMRRLVPTKVP
ncbi:MAG: hypothetical protein JJLCMIEE_02484 [Acidimicrobiales bacterium]|nr:MAG: hypothetical protein EDR02_10070 [Actinomycetota bacterium]MBV6509393.1 hypothetical protein [Acidimicrobiales bacterium]RIK06720.1 MAG: hypothetical protein DCC48_05690 [Acidobacteriota bacterium]